MDSGYTQLMWLHGLFYAVAGSSTSDFFKKAWKIKKSFEYLSAAIYPDLTVSVPVQSIRMPVFVSYFFSSLIKIQKIKFLYLPLFHIGFFLYAFSNILYLDSPKKIYI